MSRDKVFVTRQMAPAALERLSQHCDMEVWEDFLPPAYELIYDKVADLAGLLCLLTDRIDPPLMDAGSNLKVISNMAVGFDNIDIDAASERGIPVGNKPDVLTETTADFAFALLMAAARRIPEGRKYILDGKWRTWHPTVLSGQDIFGATLGIIGSGASEPPSPAEPRASTCACWSTAWKLKTNRQLGGEKVTLDDLLRESDFVTCTCRSQPIPIT